MQIPEITDENLTMLSRKIHPLVLRDGKLMQIEMPDLRNVAFSWSPVITEPATGLVEIAKIRTLHTYGYYAMFKPSVAEVLAQIPAEWIERTVAFSTRGPADADELNRDKEALNAGFHVAETTLYGLRPHIPMRSPFITVTGADTMTNIVEMLEMDVEVGFLYSAKRAGESKRYPPLNWILEASSKLPHSALHVCGSLARLQLFADELPIDNFQRVQINGDITLAQINKFLETWTDKELIIQYRGPRDNWMLEHEGPGLSILVDASGGNGVEPDSWPNLQAKVPVGFAGGLGHHNIETELPKILAVAKPGSWIDMESYVRVDEWFSLRRVQQMLDVTHRALSMIPA